MSDLTSGSMPKDASSFANLLASFTGSAKKSDQTWDDSELLDDVATISYEQALRSHRRVPASATLPVHETAETAIPCAAEPHPVAGVKERKNASITIRLTDTELAQLHKRSVAAQLSVSAYLRSCIFEAESLRAQVKEALSQMKKINEPDPHVPQEAQPKLTHKLRVGFLSRLLRPRVSG